MLRRAVQRCPCGCHCGHSSAATLAAVFRQRDRAWGAPAAVAASVELQQPPLQCRWEV